MEPLSILRKMACNDMKGPGWSRDSTRAHSKLFIWADVIFEFQKKGAFIFIGVGGNNIVHSALNGAPQ